jgi:uncharacterized membrane protein
MKRKLNRNIFLALAVSVACLLMSRAFSGQGYHTLNLFGAGYGLANLKSHFFVVANDQLVSFPYHLVFFVTGLVACAMAVAILVRHYTSRKSNA